jgi:hypothetical protein
MASPNNELGLSVQTKSDFKAPRKLNTRTYPRRDPGEFPGRPLTAEIYASRLQDHARTTAKTSICPGNHFGQLAEYLARRRQDVDLKGHTIDPSPAFFATLYHLHSCEKSDINSSKNLRWERELPQAVERLAGDSENANFLLFLRGHPTPGWLATVGAQFRVDPEYFRRHMDLNLSPGITNRFASPSLPSVSSNFITLRVTTIGKR